MTSYDWLPQEFDQKAGCCSFMDSEFLIEDQLAWLTCWIRCKALVIKGANIWQPFPTAWWIFMLLRESSCYVRFQLRVLLNHPTTCIRCSFDSPAWTSRKSLHPETAKWHISYTSPYFGAWTDFAVLHVYKRCLCVYDRYMHVLLTDWTMNTLCQNSSACVLRCAAETTTATAQKATTTSGQSPRQST